MTQFSALRRAELLDIAEAVMEKHGELTSRAIIEEYNESTAAAVQKAYTLTGAAEAVYRRRPELIAGSKAAHFCALLKNGVPRIEAARRAGIGTKTAWRVESQQRGKMLPPATMTPDEMEIATALRKKRVRLSEISRQLQRPIDDIRAIPDSRKRPQRKKQKESNDYPHQLCWSCTRTHEGPGGCSWFTPARRPVEGWDADPCVVKESHGIRVRTYAIKHCPKYAHDKRVDDSRAKANAAYYGRASK